MTLQNNYNFVIKLTTSCPANCECCVNRKKEMQRKNEGNRVFDVNHFKRICESIEKVGGSYVCLSGGEPTILNNINEYFKIAHDCGLSTRINTNGWNINKENLSNWISLGLEQIVLSIYSLNSNTIIKIRGNEKLLKRSLKAAFIIGELREKNDFQFVVQTVIMKNNYTEIADIMELAINNHADYFWPSYMEDAINLFKIRMEKEQILTFKNEIVPKMKTIAKKYDYSDDTIYSSLDGLYSSFFSDFVYHEPDFHCSWPGRHLTFYPNGSVYPCPGHEYFSSKFQVNLDYSIIDNYTIEKILSKNKDLALSNCKYCPQEIFQAVDLKKQK